VGLRCASGLKEDLGDQLDPGLVFSRAPTWIPRTGPRGMEEGGDGYLTKPVDPAELVAYIKALLRLRRARKDRAGRAKIAWPICSTTSMSLFSASGPRTGGWTTSAVKGAQLLRKDRDAMVGPGALGSACPRGDDSVFHEPFQRRHDGAETPLNSRRSLRALTGWFEVRVSPYQDGLLVFLYEVSERKRLEKPGPPIAKDGGGRTARREAWPTTSTIS